MARIPVTWSRNLVPGTSAPFPHLGNAQVMTDDGVHSGIRGARCPIIAVLPYCLVAFPSDYRVA